MMSSGECVQVCSPVILIVNKGDEVTVVDTKEDLLALVLPVDAPADAVLSAALAGYSVRCGDPDHGVVRRSGSSFEVLGERYTSLCAPVERTRSRLRVDANGSVKVLESEVISSQPGVCIGRRPAGLAPRRARGATQVGAGQTLARNFAQAVSALPGSSSRS